MAVEGPIEVDEVFELVFDALPGHHQIVAIIEVVHQRRILVASSHLLKVRGWRLPKARFDPLSQKQ